MDPEILKKFDEQQRLLEAVYRSTEKTRKYFLWVMIISIAVIVLPVIGLVFAIPQFLNTYSGVLP